MKQRKSRLQVGTAASASVLLVGALCAQAALVGHSATGAPAAKKTAPSVAALVAGYQQWPRVNPTPSPMRPEVAARCLVAPLLENAAVPSPDVEPFHSYFVTVYVNPIGQQVMMGMRRPVFPEGTIIVKEKLQDMSATAPELLTVMRKREKGYDTAAGDWEYVVMDGSGRRVLSKGRQAHCVCCHEQWKQTDYVSRVYLPAALVQQFK